jgi:TPP-dependent indolepyruvate ferredoxin oxidoreductase alpha subunit
MKRLLMGNEAIALGAMRAGVRVVTGYPGTPSTEERIGLTPKAKAVGMGELPRSEKKSTRVFDNRY